MDFDYVSDHLDSSEPDVSGDEKEPRYPRFKIEELSKSYMFKVGLEFGSLDEFKEAFTESSVLNGREIKYVKNDKARVRVVCKGNCGFLALVSKVGNKHTYRMKMWFGTHTCGRVLNNTSATSKWVAKTVAARMTSSDGVKIRDIESEIRSNFSVGITMNRAWKDKQIAKALLEGDAVKQYNLLWRYSAELRRVNPGNTCKINMTRIAPTIQPRPFIRVNGCHLKTKYGGTLLIAVGRDPNDQYYPLAFGVCENDTKESWRWFLTLLLKDIG
ncbi:uncharacterized protein LOC131650710 [Vicia villosa]|uniref:uncharacterized protein LOC131650710 n=1 Tax=Vicia villosa TaxID=3911 RepID=UPI00273BA8DC|nr:uncharacterized protein LOC131650710 [Vicia villosa]